MPLFPLRACVRACCYHCRHKKIGSDSQGFARNDRNRDPTTGYHGFFEGHRTSVQTASGRHRIRSVVVFTGKTSLASRGGAESGALPRRPRQADSELGAPHGRGSAEDRRHCGGTAGVIEHRGGDDLLGAARGPLGCWGYGRFWSLAGACCGPRGGAARGWLLEALPRLRMW